MRRGKRWLKETKISTEKTSSGWRVAVTPPQLDRELFTGTLDLVWPVAEIKARAKKVKDHGSHQSCESRRKPLI